MACHQLQFLEQIDVLSVAKPGSVFLLNSPHPPDEVWDAIPREVQEQIRDKKLQLYAIDAYAVAPQVGMGTRINTIMQTCFFEIAAVIPSDVAVRQIKEAIEKTYAKKGADVVAKNFAAVDEAVANLHRIEVPRGRSTGRPLPVLIPDHAPDFVRNVTAMMLAGRGDELPVSALPVDGTYPMGTTAWEKRNLSTEVPIWEPDICIQCGNCAYVCPQAVIQAKFYDESELEGAPTGFKSAPLAGRGFPEMKYTLHISVEDCTGSLICVEACPALSPDREDFKAINMGDKTPILEEEKENLTFFAQLPEHEVHRIDTTHVRGVQFLRPLFEFSGACAGCGETPYIKLMTQLYGDRLLIANATGCSSIFGGNLPTHPWTVNADGRGPAWSNSLFEDNAEFGYGFRLAVDKHREHAGELLRALAPQLGDASIDELTTAPQRTAQQLQAQRVRVGSWLQPMGACTLRRSPWEATMSRRCGRSRRPRSMRARRSSLRTATASPGGSTSPMGCSTSSWLSGPGIGPCTATTPTEVRTVSPDSSSIAWSPRSRSKSTHTVRGVTGSWPTPARKTPIG